jgi:hypothetical protein
MYRMTADSDHLSSLVYPVNSFSKHVLDSIYIPLRQYSMQLPFPPMILHVSYQAETLTKKFLLLYFVTSSSAEDKDFCQHKGKQKGAVNHIITCFLEMKHNDWV